MKREVSSRIHATLHTATGPDVTAGCHRSLPDSGACKSRWLRKTTRNTVPTYLLREKNIVSVKKTSWKKRIIRTNCGTVEAPLVRLTQKSACSAFFSSGTVFSSRKFLLANGAMVQSLGCGLIFHVQLVGHARRVERHLSRPLAFGDGAHVGPSGHGLL